MDSSYHINTALRGFVDRIVEKHELRDDINGDIRELYGEVKEAGFVVGVVRGLVREYRMDSEARDALYQHQNEYRIALGMLADTPLGDYAEQHDDATRRHADGMAAALSQTTPQPRRGRGRPRKTPIEDAIETARAQIPSNGDGGAVAYEP